MRVAVNYDLCAGHGQCLLGAPTVFDLPDDATQVVVLDPTPAAELKPVVVRAAAMCPAAAISVAD